MLSAGNVFPDSPLHFSVPPCTGVNLTFDTQTDKDWIKPGGRVEREEMVRILVEDVGASVKTLDMHEYRSVARLIGVALLRSFKCSGEVRCSDGLAIFAADSAQTRS